MEAVGAEQEVKSYSDVEANLEIKEILGHGSFGIVKRVIDKRNNRECALKIPTRNSVAEIKDECAMMDKLNKASGVAPQLYECGHDYILMELVKGEPLKSWMGGHDKEEIPDILRTFASLIDTIHEAGIIHGDLNAENVIVTSSGWMAIDFGFSSEDNDESWDTISRVLLKIVNPLFYPQVLEDPDLQQKLHSWCVNASNTSDIKDIADTLESEMAHAKAEFDESEGPIDKSLRRLALLIRR
jgi:tRNA A-37 threonylcarbamoyl transferase component Bud32